MQTSKYYHYNHWIRKSWLSFLNILYLIGWKNTTYFVISISIDVNNVNALDGKGAALGSIHKYGKDVFYFDKALSISLNDPVALEGKTVSSIANEVVTSSRN